MKVEATARVQVMVEFDMSGWGDDCKLDQVFDQAGKEILQKVHNLIIGGGGRIIGESKVIAVLVERARP